MSATILLLQLNLRHLEITDIDAKYIAQALMRNHSLQTLDIVCFISNDGIYDVFESLMLNNTLKKLYIPKTFHPMAFNRIREDHGLPLIEIVMLEAPVEYQCYVVCNDHCYAV